MVDETEKPVLTHLKENESSTIKGSKVRKRNMVIAVIVVGILLVASMVFFYSGAKHENQGTPSDVLQLTNVNMTAVGVPLPSINQTAVWYGYDVSGSTVRFFVVKDASGTIHAAFDECWMCFNTHLGYRQSGDYMIENCCNMSFPISQITKEGCSIADCAPIFLPSSFEGDHLVFTKSDLAKQRFTFLTVDETTKVQAYNSTHVAIPLVSVS